LNPEGQKQQQLRDTLSVLHMACVMFNCSDHAGSAGRCSICTSLMPVLRAAGSSCCQILLLCRAAVACGAFYGLEQSLPAGAWCSTPLVVAAMHALAVLTALPWWTWASCICWAPLHLEISRAADARLSVQLVGRWHSHARGIQHTNRWSEDLQQVGLRYSVYCAAFRSEV
jgi:hypothetical protein